jgi:hypothetical protein
MPKHVCKKNHLNKKTKEKETKVGKKIALRMGCSIGS